MKRRHGSLVVNASFWLTLTACSLPHQHEASISVIRQPGRHASLATVAHPAPPASNPSPTFRLGTAARPFGWSTVISDFNTDGTPDVAVADRTARRADGYAYQLEVSVSGLESRSVVFQSTYEAVTVGVADVDQDDDFDIVVSAVPSRDIVGIWLNDGDGHFQAADVHRFASSVGVVGSAAIADPSVNPSSAGLPAGRVADGQPVLNPVTLARSPATFGSVRPNRLQLPLHSASVGPRAPPPHFA